MTPARRWCLVALVAVVLVAGPIALRSLPAGRADVSRELLLEQVRGSLDRSWSGSVELEGTLQLPDADQFSRIAALFGERTALRAWWRGPEEWRVDRLLTTGETDLFHDGATTVEWDYERARATVSHDPDIRLPRAADLLPPVLAERLMRGASATDVSRLPARRLTGRTAAGLRLVPPSPLSSIGHIDLWADVDSGVPLQVEVYADGARSPAFTSRFTTFSPDRPDAATVDFQASAGTDVELDEVLDIADAANQYAPFRPPRLVAGLARSAASDGAVGVYGEGSAQLIAIPLRDREANAFRDQMLHTPGVEQDAARTVVTLGPLGVLLTGADGDGGWLLAGTVTRDALGMAAEDVLAGTVFVEDGR